MNECVDCDFNVTTAHYITVDAATSDNITLKLCSPSISLQTVILEAELISSELYSSTMKDVVDFSFKIQDEEL